MLETVYRVPTTGWQANRAGKWRRRLFLNRLPAFHRYEYHAVNSPPRRSVCGVVVPAFRYQGLWLIAGLLLTPLADRIITGPGPNRVCRKRASRARWLKRIRLKRLRF